MADHHHSKNAVNTFAILSLFLVGVIILCDWTPIGSTSVLLSRKNIYWQSNSAVLKDDLDIALEKASMPNKTVIIVIVNKAYVEPQKDEYPTMFDLFLEGFWVGEETRSLVNHLLVVAMDQTAYERCRFQRLHCYRLVTDGVDYSGEKKYMSQDFIKMMWGRTRFLLEVLKRGYNFIFTDADVIWLRNPFSRLGQNTTEDLQISTDNFNGNPHDENNEINTGFYSIKSNNRTIKLFETWYDMRNNSTKLKEQDVLVNMMHQGVARKLGLSIKFLDTLYFSGFCKDSEDVKQVVTVHSNCCRYIHAKIADLKEVVKDWKKLKKSVSRRNKNKNNSSNFQWSKHIACGNSWAIET